MKNNKVKLTLKIILFVLSLLIAVFACYVIYCFGSYKRIDDFQDLEINKSKSQTELQTQNLKIDNEYKAVSYNIGFAAYLHDFSFFMDGGTQSWAKSKDSVIETSENIGNYLNDLNADFYSLQEVDSNSTRTYHVDETEIIKEKMNKFSSVDAVCFDSPFLMYPITQPHGASVSNLMTLSKYLPYSSLRRQLKVDDGFTKILDYDRCYSITRYKVENGKDFVLFTTHTSAYAKDPSTSNSQIEMLVGNMQSELEKGNYVICAADFNKQLVDDTSKYYKPERIYECKPFPKQYLAGTGISLVAPFNEKKPVGTCRDAGVNYFDDIPICNIDGFMVSSNIEVCFSDVCDTKFEFSDHNPVFMTFKLK